MAGTAKTDTKKPKLIRDSFTIPKAEYAVIDEMKARALRLGQSVKKSELLRAGLKLLQHLNDPAFKTAISAVPTLKTGRPAAEAPPTQAPKKAKKAGAMPAAAGEKSPATLVGNGAQTASKVARTQAAKTLAQAPAGAVAAVAPVAATAAVKTGANRRSSKATARPPVAAATVKPSATAKG